MVFEKQPGKVDRQHTMKVKSYLTGNPFAPKI